MSRKGYFLLLYFLKPKIFSLCIIFIKMMFKSPMRKNYLLNNQNSIIAERRQQSDSNSPSLSRSYDSNNKKSPNNSLEKIKREQIKKKEDNFNKIQPRVNIINRNSNNNLTKMRSQSINYMHSQSTASGRNNQISQTNQKNKHITSIRYDSIVLNKNLKKGQQVSNEHVKLGKLESQISQISTQQPRSFVNNFMVEDQRPGFVRFSEIIIDPKGKSHRKSTSGKKGSLSILKNRKNAVSCNKIDSNYLKFRDKTINEKEKPQDIIKNKYKQIVDGLKEKFFKRSGKRNYAYFDIFQEERYRDQLFPTNSQSIFFTRSKIDQLKAKFQQNLQFQLVEIGWRRISEHFHPNSRLVVYKQNSRQRIIKNQFSLASNELVLSLNAIKNVSQQFRKIFQSSCDKYERRGAYCLKIFQQNVWKSIIIDDFVPIVWMRNKKTQQMVVKSLFVDIQVPQNGQQIEIWPYLLQKAYASYYNSYESLNESFKMIDWLEQILMTPSECYYFPDNQQINQEAVKRLQKSIHQFPSSESIIIGFNIKTKQPCVIQKRHSPNSQQQQVTLKTLKSQRKMKIKHLLQIIHKFYLFLPFHFKYFNTCSLNFNKSGKKTLKQHPMGRIKYRDQIFVRTFTAEEDGPFSITIRQKQRRFYLRNIKKYQYIWIRVLLVQKEFGNTYRWIDGKYSNQKAINFNICLQKGQYEVIVMPEWQPQQTLHDLTMIVLSNTQIGIQRKIYEEGQKLIETACCDIAQRKGVFKQLNDFTCSYSFVEKITGIIIQNINNEKSQGGVAISRSIEGIKAKVQIYPFNLEFCINQYESSIHKRKYKKNIDILIDPNTHYTVLLMMKGGIDEKFFKVFKFGN